MQISTIFPAFIDDFSSFSLSDARFILCDNMLDLSKPLIRESNDRSEAIPKGGSRERQPFSFMDAGFRKARGKIGLGSIESLEDFHAPSSLDSSGRFARFPRDYVSPSLMINCKEDEN